MKSKGIEVEIMEYGNKVTNNVVINFEGEKVALGPLCTELNPLICKWNNDFAVSRTTALSRPTTIEEQVQAYEQFTKDKSYAFFAVYDKATLTPIGMTYLSGIKDGNCEFGIIIGEKDYQGKGYGTEATALTIDYGFTVLGLHNIMLTVYEYNQAGFQAYKKAGFVEFGRRHQAKYYAGKHWDVIYMECLSTSFTSTVLSKVFKQ